MKDIDRWRDAVRFENRYQQLAKAGEVSRYRMTIELTKQLAGRRESDGLKREVDWQVVKASMHVAWRSTKSM